jgi:hypothetical protein
MKDDVNLNATVGPVDLASPDVQRKIKQAVGETLTSPSTEALPVAPEVVVVEDQPESSTPMTSPPGSDVIAGGPGVIVAGLPMSVPTDSNATKVEWGPEANPIIYSSNDPQPRSYEPKSEPRKAHQRQIFLGKKAAKRRVKSKIARSSRRRNRR